jgi:hypothetical protein
MGHEAANAPQYRQEVTNGGATLPFPNMSLWSDVSLIKHWHNFSLFNQDTLPQQAF